MTACKINIVDELTGKPLSFVTTEAYDEYRKNLNRVLNENTFQERLDELNKDEKKKSEMNLIFDTIQDFFFKLKSKYQEISELSKNNPAVAAVFNSLKTLDDARFHEIINQSKFMFASIQQYRVIGTELLNNAIQINQDFKDGKLSLAETHEKLRGISEYYFSIQKISHSLERYIRNFVKDNDHAIYGELRAIDNIQNALTSEVGSVALDNIAQMLFDEFPEDANLSLNDEIRSLEVRISRLQERGNIKEADKLKTTLEVKQKQRITLELIKDMILKKGGKSNALSNFVEDILRSSNYILASARKRLQRNIDRANRKFIPVAESMAKAFHNFKKETGRVPSNLKNMSEGVYEFVKNYKYDKDTNEIVEETYLELNKWYDVEKLSKDMATFEERIENAKSPTEKIQIENEYSRWKIDNLQQEYNEKISDIQKLLIPEAKQERDRINTAIRLQYEELNQNYTEEGDRNLRLLIIEKGALGYKYDKNRNEKTGIELAIAESIKAYNSAWADVFEDPSMEDEIIAEEKKNRSYEILRLSLEKLKQAMGYDGEAKRIIDLKAKRWKLSNERRVIHESFNTKRTEINEKIKTIKQRLGQSVLKSEREMELWNKIFEITSQYRDKNGVIQGEYLTNEEVKTIKQYEDEIQTEREISKNAFGISEIEYKKLTNIIKKYKLDKYDKKEGSYASYVRGLHSYVMPHINENLKGTEFTDDLEFVKSFDENLTLAAQSNKNKKLLMTEEEISKTTALEKERDDLYEELFSMQKTEYTTNYYEEYEKQLNNFIDYYKEQGIEVTEQQFQDLSGNNDLNNSWYVDNHKIMDRWDPDLREKVPIKEPIYIWREVLPSDESLVTIKPAYHFYNQKIKDEYLNKNYETDPFHNKPLPKRGGQYDKKDKYSSLPIGVRNAIDFLTQQYSEFQSMIKEEYLRPGYKIPSNEKDFYDRAIEGQITPTKLYNSITRQFKPTEQDIDEGIGLNVNTFDKLFTVVPVKGVSKIKEIDASLDIWESISKFGLHTIMRSEFAPDVKNFNDLYNIIKGDDQDLHLEDKNVNSFALLSGLKSLRDKNDATAKALEQMIRTLIYGELRNREEKGVFSFQKIAGTANKLAAFNTLLWNVPSVFVNVFTAKTQAFIQSAGGHMVTTKELAQGDIEFSKRSHIILKDSVERLLGDMSPITKMGIAWGFVQGGLDSVAHKGYGEDRFKQFVKSGFGGRYLRDLSEHQVQTAFGFAVLKKHKITITNKDGVSRITSLLEFYEEIANKYGIYSLSDLQNSKYKNDYVIDSTEWNSKKEEDLQMQIFDVNQTMNGLYDSLHKAFIEKGSLGVMLFFFRKYLVPAVVERFEGGFDTRYNIVQNRRRSGQYVTLFRKVLQPLFKGSIGDLDSFTQMKETIQELVKKDPNGTLTIAERENFRKLAAEFSVIITMGLLIAAIGDDDDDLKEHSFMTLYALYFAKKLKSETEQFIPAPFFGLNEIQGVLRTPSIALNQLAMWNRMFNDLKYTFTGDEKAYLQKDSYGFYKEGDSKLLRDILALGTGFKGNSFYPEALIRNFDYAQRNR